MGELIRFPGAEADHEFLDSFKWTDELLREHAGRARALADRYGKTRPLSSLPRWPRAPLSGLWEDACRPPRAPLPRRPLPALLDVRRKPPSCQERSLSPRDFSTVYLAEPVARAELRATLTGNVSHVHHGWLCRRSHDCAAGGQCLAGFRTRDLVTGKHRMAAHPTPLRSSEMWEIQHLAAQALGLPMDHRVLINAVPTEGHDSRPGFRRSLRRGQART